MSIRRDHSKVSYPVTSDFLCPYPQQIGLSLWISVHNRSQEQIVSVNTDVCAHTCMLKGLQNNEHIGHPPRERQNLCHRLTSISENYILKMEGKSWALVIKNTGEGWKLGGLSQHSAQLSPQAGGCFFQGVCNTQDLFKTSLPRKSFLRCKIGLWTWKCSYTHCLKVAFFQ